MAHAVQEDASLRRRRCPLRAGEEERLTGYGARDTVGRASESSPTAAESGDRELPSPLGYGAMPYAHCAVWV
jgi:hypothetical protein